MKKQTDFDYRYSTIAKVFIVIGWAGILAYGWWL